MRWFLCCSFLLIVCSLGSGVAFSQGNTQPLAYFLANFTHPADSVALSPDGNYLAVGASIEHKVYFYQMSAGSSAYGGLTLISTFQNAWMTPDVFRYAHTSSPLLLQQSGRILLINPFDATIVRELASGLPDYPSLSPGGAYYFRRESTRFETLVHHYPIQAGSTSHTTSVGYEPYSFTYYNTQFFPFDAGYMLLEATSAPTTQTLRAFNASGQQTSQLNVPASQVRQVTRRGYILFMNSLLVNGPTGTILNDPAHGGSTDVVSISETATFKFTQANYYGIRPMLLEDLDRMLVGMGGVAINDLDDVIKTASIRYAPEDGDDSQPLDQPLRVAWNMDRWAGGTGARITLVGISNNYRYTFPDVWSVVGAGIAHLQPPLADLQPGLYRLDLVSTFNPLITSFSNPFNLVSSGSGASAWSISE